MPNTYTICSIYPFKLEHFYPSFVGKNRYIIEAGSPEAPTYVEVEDAYENEHRIGSKDQSDMRRMTVSAESIANDLVRAWAGNFTEVHDFMNCSPGIRVIQGKVVTQDELAELIRVQRAFAKVKVAEADRFYQEKQFFRIQPVHLASVKILGTSRPEYEQATLGKVLVKCFFCSTMIPPDVSDCPNCRNILNMALHKENQVRAQQASVGGISVDSSSEAGMAKVLAEAAKKTHAAAAQGQR